MGRDHSFAGHAKPNTARSWHGFVAHAYCGGGRHSATNTQLKNDNWIETLEHPAQSPDLNPIEAIWNLLNERVHQRDWRDQYELRTVIEEEWKRITLEEIRARIAEMPWRCRMLREGNHTKLIKSKLW